MIDALKAVSRTFGPFAIPVALFVAGFVGYAALVLLGRAGLVQTGDGEAESGDGWERR